MNHQQYSDFLNDPCAFLNNGSVDKLRLDGSVMAMGKTAVSHTVNFPGSVPLRYLYEKASVRPVTIEYSDTGIPPTSAVWVRAAKASGKAFDPDTKLAEHKDVKDRAYYLNWDADTAYAVELGFEAQLFFTAELTGCGIIVLTGGGKTVLVHHNIQVTAPDPTFFQNLFESQAKRQARETAFVGRKRTDSLYLLLQNIVKQNPTLTSGKMLGVQQYGGASRFFGMKRNGLWRFYINRPVGNVYKTHELFA